ncbi:uncharacterized [Tachysurus ichikawai]
MERRNSQRAVTLNCQARAGCDKDLEAIGTTKKRQRKTGQLFVSVRQFSLLDEATRAVTFKGAGISRTGTVQKGLGDCRMSDRPMLKRSTSDLELSRLRIISLAVVRELCKGKLRP